MRRPLVVLGVVAPFTDDDLSQRKPATGDPDAAARLPPGWTRQE